jgi:hypothetical protein
MAARLQIDEKNDIGRSVRFWREVRLSGQQHTLFVVSILRAVPKVIGVNSVSRFSVMSKSRER